MWVSALARAPRSALPKPSPLTRRFTDISGSSDLLEVAGATRTLRGNTQQAAGELKVDEASSAGGRNGFSRCDGAKLPQQIRRVDVGVVGEEHVYIVDGGIRERAGFGHLQQRQQWMTLLRCGADQSEKQVSATATESREILDPVI